MAKEFPCIENLIELQYRGDLLRIWVDKAKLEYNFDFERVLVNKILRQEPNSVTEMIRFIAKQKGVNAVSYGESNKDQTVRYSNVVYTIPFSEDVHG